MPTFKVKGADRATGKDRVESIVADDRRGAELQLKKLGILVESLEEDRPAPATPPAKSAAIEYATAGLVKKNPPPAPAAAAATPAAATLPSLAFTLAFAGVILIVAGIVVMSEASPVSDSFHTDNAIGETANRMDQVRVQLEQIKGVGFIICGILAWVVSALTSHRPATPTPVIPN